MNDIWWQTIGEGDCHLVLLHGWGLNAQVWDCITPQLASHFTLHLVDLPGYGRSGGFGAMSLEAMAQRVLEQAPPQAVWLGWSLGGLVASQVAIMRPERVQALVMVASSPCFAARDDWPGIKPEVLAGFQQQLSDDFQRTVERFLALQTMGTESARQDARALKQAVLAADAFRRGAEWRTGDPQNRRSASGAGQAADAVSAAVWPAGWTGAAQDRPVAG